MDVPMLCTVACKPSLHGGDLLVPDTVCKARPLVSFESKLHAVDLEIGLRGCCALIRSGGHRHLTTVEVHYVVLRSVRNQHVLCK